MNPLRLIVAGGGAAGFFGAIHAAEKNPKATVVLLEKGSHPLAKVKISGGGRCNVTHDCLDPRELSTRYPRGGKALIGLFTRFGPKETTEWFASRGVKLKTEPDGRMFPVTDSSQTVIDCLTEAAHKAGVKIMTQTGVQSIRPGKEGGFILQLTHGSVMECDRLLWAVGGFRTESNPLASLGLRMVDPVPSLFTFHVELPWVQSLAGLSVPQVEVSVPDVSLQEKGPLLFTHQGFSGPAILRISAWGARPLHQRSYRFPLRINWLSQHSMPQIQEEMQNRRETQGAQTVLRSKWNPLPTRLWEQLVTQAGITPEDRWSKLSRESGQRLAQTLHGMELPVSGKSMNKEEFVTCGGIALDEVEMKTMQSRKVPGLFFAGEILDIDGITGGFNFQAAWTTGWTAGRTMAEAS